MAPYNLLGGSQCFRGTFCFRFKGKGHYSNSTFICEISYLKIKLGEKDSISAIL